MSPGHLRIVLVEPQGQANIGAVARSMACFQVRDLHLVQPRTAIRKTAEDWACQHGMEVLKRRTETGDLAESLRDVNLAVAMTRRKGKRRHRMMGLPTFVESSLPQFLPGRVALVFGNEESGLSNEHLDLCQRSVVIPTDPGLGSLNLAQAVNICLYEFVGRTLPAPATFNPVAPPELRQRMLQEVGRFLEDFSYPSHAATLEEEMTKFADLLERARLEVWEVNLLLGVLRHFRFHLGRKYGLP